MARPTTALVPFLCAPFALLAPSLVAQGWLDPVRIPAQPDPGDFHLLGDFDGNGADDLVWFRGVSGTPTPYEGFRVQFNDGTGDFPGAGPFVGFSAAALQLGHRFRPLAEQGLRRARDLTGDARPDVLVVEALDSTTDLFLHLHGSAGPGTFSAPVSVPLTGLVRGAALGQVDADPEFELAVLETIGFTWELRWYDFVAGALLPSAPATVTFPGIFAFKFPARLEAVDVDLDGDHDVVVGDSSGQGLRVFATAAGVPGSPSVVTLPVPAFSRIDPFAGDLAGGAAEDLLLVVKPSASSSAVLFPALAGAGGLAVGTPTTIVPSVTEGFGTGGFTLGDWDGDGDSDLMNHPWIQPGSSTDGVVAFFENDGANGFSGPVAKASTRGTRHWPLPTSDLDGDGHLDLPLPHGALFGRGRFESSLVVVGGTFPAAAPVAARDHDDDGDIDLYFADGSVRTNDGDGRFSSWAFLPPPPPGVVSRSVASVGDFTGDGRVDVLTAHHVPLPPLQLPGFHETRLYGNDGLGGFSDLGTASTAHLGPYSRTVNVSADLDQDGDLDVLDGGGQGGFFPNAGGGTFLPFVPLFGASTEPCAVADVDADGDLDVAGAELGVGVKVWKDQGGLNFTGALLHVDVSPIEADSMTFADHDGDGDLDLACAPLWGESILLFANDGSGQYASGAVLSAPLTTGNDPPMSSLAFDDVDGDGVIDLLAGASSSPSGGAQRALLYRGLGGGSFQSARAYAGSLAGESADLDGDGDLDLSGHAVVRSRRFGGPEDGTIRQFGVGLAGTGNAVPLLGARGPVRVGSSSAELRLRRGRGAAPVVLLFGPTETVLPNLPVFGATLYVGFPLSSVTLPLTGPPATVAAGTLDLDLTPVLPLLAGFTLHLQAAVLDSGASDGIATSNGLTLTFG